MGALLKGPNKQGSCWAHLTVHLISILHDTQQAHFLSILFIRHAVLHRGPYLKLKMRHTHNLLNSNRKLCYMVEIMVVIYLLMMIKMINAAMAGHF